MISVVPVALSTTMGGLGTPRINTTVLHSSHERLYSYTSSSFLAFLGAGGSIRQALTRDCNYVLYHAFRVLQKCWIGYKIGKGQYDIKRMKYHADGIRKAQSGLVLKVDSFPNCCIE